MLRTHTCGELRIEHVGSNIKLSGWAHRVRNKGSLVWIDLRDRYGITQLVFQEGVTDPSTLEDSKNIGREYVLQVEGTVGKRLSSNDNISTGAVEVLVSKLKVLNASKVPPFTVEDDSDGGDDLRMKYRYLDLRRAPVRYNMELRHRMMQATRSYLDNQEFIEVETPILIKSTPEGARDFVVPSRMNQGQFYALPQSPQTFKQLLMVAGFDRYFQLCKCFRDEDLRADRQPEFTQIDCEMSFVEQEDILNMFEGLVGHLFKDVMDVDLSPLPRISYAEAMEDYGNDKPDIRFGMKLKNLTEVVAGKGFKVFDESETVLAIVAPGCASYSRKQLDALTNWVRRPQIGAKGLVYVKCNTDGTFKSSVDKFYSQEDLQAWAEKTGAQKGDLMLLLSGDDRPTRKAMSELRLEMGRRLELMNPKEFKALWVLDFPLLEWDEDSARYHAMHHPFTSPKQEDFELLQSDPGKVRANAYDMVINGQEVGGGSIRIHDREMQNKMFTHLGFTEEEALSQFGFLLEAFEYGAPPHGGIAFGFDRLCSIFGGADSIRDFIAFPKNNSGRDTMIDSPSLIDKVQLKELGIDIVQNED